MSGKQPSLGQYPEPTLSDLNVLNIVICVVNGEVNFPSRIFKDLSNIAAEITFGEAYEIKGFILLTGPREQHSTACMVPYGSSSKEADSTKQWGSQGGMRTSGQVPLLGVRVEYTSKRHEGLSLLNFHQWSKVGDGKKGNSWEVLDLLLIHLVTQAGCSQPVYGYVEAAGKYDILNFTI